MRRLLSLTIPTICAYQVFCSENQIQTISPPQLKSRAQHFQEIRSNPNYDVVIIGGGCNGAGVALDASSRGLKTLLIEANDFGSGASSKSTKLIHGGLRYLQAVFMSTDSIKKRKQNFQLVKEALEDRKFMIQNAEYMNHKLKFVIPYSSLFQQLYYYAGTLVYHFITWYVSDKSGIQFTFPYFLNQTQLKAYFPFISHKYQGGIVFEDGQFNDSQMLMSVLLTSTLPSNANPSNILNQSEFLRFIKSQQGKITGLIFKDKISNQQIAIKSRYVVNCTGAFSDKIRQIDDPKVRKRLVPVAGSHITFDKRITEGDHGIIINSDDGRVLIVVPWLGRTLAGTTERKLQQPVNNPTISIEQKRFIYDQMNNVFDDIAISELLRLERSNFTGIRPLVLQNDEEQTDTKKVSRRHVIQQSKSGLISLMGGKWTIYRQMGQDVVDLVMKDLSTKDKIRFKSSQTEKLKLIGSNYPQNLKKQLQQKYGKAIGHHMFTTYGGIAPYILSSKNNQPLDPEIGITKSQIQYIIKYQMPTQIQDVLLRRTRLAFQDRRKPKLLVPFVASQLSKQFKWSEAQTQQKIKQFQQNYQKYEF